jgi:hypothetical protein
MIRLPAASGVRSGRIRSSAGSTNPIAPVISHTDKWMNQMGGHRHLPRDLRRGHHEFAAPRKQEERGEQSLHNPQGDAYFGLRCAALAVV